MIRKRNIILAFAAATVLSVAAVIGVAAQPGGEADDQHPQRGEEFIARLAANLGIGEDDLRAALQQTATELVDEAVAEGRIPEDKAAQLKERIAAGEAGPLFRRGSHDGARGHQGQRIGILRGLADAIGIEPEQLREELRDSTPAAVADAHGIDRETLKATLLGQVTERLDTLVADGKITSEQRDAAIEQAQQRIDSLLDRSPDDRPGNLSSDESGVDPAVA